MTAAPEGTGIGYLIAVLKSSNRQAQGISPRQFTEALRIGVETEPERFTELVQELEARIQRSYPDWLPRQARARALENIAGYAVMADHNYETEMLVRGALGGPKGAEEYLDDPKEYGPAMKLLAAYVGIEEGLALRRFISEQMPIN